MGSGYLSLGQVQGPSRSRPKFCTRVSTRSSIGAVYDTPKGGLLCGKLFCLGSWCGTGQTEFLQPNINKTDMKHTTLDHFFLLHKLINISESTTVKVHC